MKRILSTSFIGLLVALAVSTTAKAQFEMSNIISRSDTPYYMKLIIENFPDPGYHSRNYDGNFTNITTRAIRHFLENFNEVCNETWYCTPALFVAMFKLNDIDSRVEYDKNGNWIETYRNYGETKMSPDVRQAVKSSYPDYDIYLVEEFEQPLYPIAYIIHLENKTKLINVRVSDGVIYEYEWQKFNKSK
jgi:hypothetical protein